LTALGVDLEPLAMKLDDLAQIYDLSPAQIKGAALTACYIALAANRPVSIQDLDEGAIHELTKEGRSVSASTSNDRRRNGHRLRNIANG
jgi:hypothetical protein